MTNARRKIVAQTIVAAALITVLGLATGAGVGYLDAQHGVSSVSESPYLVWIVAVFASLIMLASLVIGLRWMRSIDEAAREAHKAAWFWGGSGGMAVGGVAVILSVLPQAEGLSLPSGLAGRTDPAAYLATGAFAMLLLMLVGYGVVWAWWWLARR